MKTILGTLVALFGVMTLATGCSTSVEESAQSGILADGEFSTDSINVLPYSRGRFIKIDGSSTVFPISYEAARRYQQEVSDAPALAVSFSGTGSGFKKFCAGKTDINDASRPINSEEMATCKANGVKYLELPIALDAITLVVNPENTWASDITVPELAKIWQPEAEGKIENWSQIRQSWPDRPLNLYGPGADSGTFDYFTQVIVGETSASRKDYTQSKDGSILVDRVSEDPGGLGYVGLGYYTANWNRLDSLAVDNGQKSSQPTVDEVQSFKYQPLTRPLFIYVNAATVKNKPELQKFIQFYLEDVRKWVPFVGYVPLEKETSKLVFERFQQQIIGTVYGGELQSEVPIEQMLQRESVF